MSLESHLSRQQIETLEAVTERMLPSDDGVGAAEAHVMGHIRWIASKPFFRKSAPKFASGLDMLQMLAQSHHGLDFAACDSDQQDQVLEELRKIPHPVAQKFLAAILSLTLAGFLCDPRYGGNQGEVGWEFLGFQRRTASPEEA